MSELGDYLRKHRLAIALMFFGAALSLIGAAFGAHVAIGIGLLCAIAGIALLFWPKPREQPIPDAVIAVRDELQRLLDEVGEEPRMRYDLNGADFRALFETWAAHFNKLHHRFERTLAPRIQDIIHRLGEDNNGDARLELAMQSKEKNYKTVKEVLDRLSVLASRLHGK